MPSRKGFLIGNGSVEAVIAKLPWAKLNEPTLRLPHRREPWLDNWRDTAVL